jgi:hypothetical protein
MKSGNCQDHNLLAFSWQLATNHPKNKKIRSNVYNHVSLRNGSATILSRPVRRAKE